MITGAFISSVLGATNQYYDDSQGRFTAEPGKYSANCKDNDCVTSKSECVSSGSIKYSDKWICFEGKWSICDDTNVKAGITHGDYACKKTRSLGITRIKWAKKSPTATATWEEKFTIPKKIIEKLFESSDKFIATLKEKGITCTKTDSGNNYQYSCKEATAKTEEKKGTKSDCTVSVEKDDSGVVGKDNTVGIKIKTTKCKGYIVSPSGDAETAEANRRIKWVTTSPSKEITSDAQDITVTYECAKEGSDIKFFAQLRNSQIGDVITLDTFKVKCEKGATETATKTCANIPNDNALRIVHTENNCGSITIGQRQAGGLSTYRWICSNDCDNKVLSVQCVKDISGLKLENYVCCQDSQQKKWLEEKYGDWLDKCVETTEQPSSTSTTGKCSSPEGVAGEIVCGSNKEATYTCKKSSTEDKYYWYKTTTCLTDEVCKETVSTANARKSECVKTSTLSACATKTTLTSPCTCGSMIIKDLRVLCCANDVTAWSVTDCPTTTTTNTGSPSAGTTTADQNTCKATVNSGYKCGSLTVQYNGWYCCAAKSIAKGSMTDCENACK